VPPIEPFRSEKNPSREIGGKEQMREEEKKREAWIQATWRRETV
jgi:hypothetical protein